MAPAMVLISIRLAAMAIALASVGAGAHPWCSAREPSTGAAATLTTVRAEVSSTPSAWTTAGDSSTSRTAGPGTTSIISTASITRPASPPQRTCDPGHQRLVDPGFEDTVAGGAWVFLPDSMVVRNSTDPAHTGSRAVLNDIRDTGDGTQFSQQLAGLDPEREYAVSLWWALTAQQGMGDGACEIAIQLDGQVIGGVSIPPGGAFAWSRSDQHTARPAVPDPVLAVHLTCFAFFGFTSVEILVDDVSLTCV